MGERLKICCIIIIDILVLSYLPADNLFQIFCGVCVLFPIAAGVYIFKKVKCSFSALDALFTAPYVFLLIDYLVWDGILRILTNLFIIFFSTVGLYCYINSKNSGNKK